MGNKNIDCKKVFKNEKLDFQMIIFLKTNITESINI